MISRICFKIFQKKEGEKKKEVGRSRDRSHKIDKILLNVQLSDEYMGEGLSALGYVRNFHNINTKSKNVAIKWL